MSAHFVLRDSHTMPTPMYLNGIARRGLKALFVFDITKARRFSKEDIRQHRKAYPHITGRFVSLEAEIKRIAKATAGGPPCCLLYTSPSPRDS